MPATYTKLRDGSWGIRCDGEAAKAGPGNAITVTTKAGQAKSETIARVLWSGEGVSVCTIAQRQRPQNEASGDRRREVFRRKYGWDGKVGSSSYYTSGLYDEES